MYSSLARGNPVNVDSDSAVKKVDHHALSSGLAFLGLGESLGLWILTVGPGFVTGYQKCKYSWVGGNVINHLPHVNSVFLSVCYGAPWEHTMHKLCTYSNLFE